MKRFWVVLVLILLAFEAKADGRCIGAGDGGGFPFSLIPESVSNQPNYVKTQSLLYDFVFWERANQILYVDQWENYRTHGLSSQAEKVVLMSGMSAPISRVVDPQNRYFTNKISGVVFDTKNENYISVPYNSQQKEIFWEDSVLYSFPQASMSSSNGLRTIYALDTVNRRLNWCNVRSNGFWFNPAEQSSFPFLYGYESKPTGDGKFRIRPLRIDVRKALKNKTCSVEDLPEYLDPFPAPVLAMYHYAKLDGNLFRLDHPKKQLLWDRGKDECTYFDLENKHFSIIRGQVPLVALWDMYSDLKILHPRKMQRESFPEMGKFGFTSSDFALSNDGKRLFVAQRPEANSGALKMLYQFELNEVP